MTIALAIFAKNPDLSPVKTRLAQDIGKKNAILFYRLCLQCTRETLHRLMDSSKYAITPYWALAEQESLHLPEWQCFNTLWTGNGNLGERLHHVYSTLLAQHDAVILIGTDSPALPVALLVDALNTIKIPGQHTVIGPANDGGFYLFGGKHPVDRQIWLDTPYSASNTLQVLSSQLQAHQIPMAFLPMHFDVDTKSDLTAVQDYLQQQVCISDAQQELLQFIGRL